MVRKSDAAATVICFAFALAIGSTPLTAQTSQGPEQGTASAGTPRSTTAFPTVPPSVPYQQRPAAEHEVELLPDPLDLAPPLAPLGSNEQDDPNRLLRGPGILAPSLVNGFLGITQTNFIPPDPIIAAGPNHLLALVNSDFAIFQKDGTKLQQINARSWFGNVAPGNNAFDPKVFYDHFADRWVMTYLSTDLSTFSHILVSVSDDADPTGDWCNYVFRGDLNGSTPDSTLSDYQGAGFDNSAVYIVPNQFRLSDLSFRYVKLRIIPKAALYDTGCPAVPYTDFWDLRDPANLAAVVTVRPAHTFGTPGVEYLINDSPFVPGTFMTLWSLTNPLDPSPTLSAVNVPVTLRNPPPNADQLGGSSTLIDVGGPRVRNAVYRDGSIWTAHSVADASGEFARARYVRIDVTGPTVLEDVSFGNDDCWLYYPAITADVSNNMVMVYNQSCVDEYVGIRYTGRRPLDAALQPSVELKAGEANYVVAPGSPPRNRWGDYSGVAVDAAVTNHVWVFAEYAGSPEDTWSTWIGEVVASRLRGDVNADDAVDVADVVLLVDIILERVTPTEDDAAAANCNLDGALDIGDAVCLVNLILTPTSGPTLAAARPNDAPESVRLSEAAFDPVTGRRIVTLEAELGPDVAGLQARIGYDAARVRIGWPELGDAARGLVLETNDLGGELLLVLYARGGVFPARSGKTLVRLPVELSGDEETDPGLELRALKVADRSGTVRRPETGSATLTALPTRFRLGEPYPNPVGQAGTQIELEIPASIGPALSGGVVGASSGGPVRVVVEVFNVRGQKVRTVLAEELAPGQHSIRWDGRSDRGVRVGTGVYVLRLRAGTFVENRKLIVNQ
ncbi:MAG: hypothetical protein GWN99_10540 [Gemmatimonadetes bacterium]|uniref:Dockerin domain-containing protein n=1 Tax=Candidatus Kutchimonas denitrificans TaxID=3056748 RepID=A0AAE5CBN0_9BACT|nr:hypothetical protein [Gemmatimonadota bacterium]NIR74733.1 hypothetical protein [Candidatus Kutchimonas denitrificans]NIS01483.1 hypothetical protein [Gemmatimonadota bacterium]NIT67224.1 hypothetical protein [Gemmatimonadota bacterium]NIU52398.1 hypothetical protein [Gemmatimonadota bacterium]